MLAEHIPDAARGNWATRPDRVAILRKHLRGKASEQIAAVAGLDFGPIDLPGPTGEANTVRLVPRGKALCLGPDSEALVWQVVQALGAGNAVLAVAPIASEALKPLVGKGLPLAVIDGQIEPSTLEALELDLVALSGDGEDVGAMRRALAAWDGKIVPLVTEVAYPAAYAHERAVCVDTTAAGGNASLLASS